MSDPWPGAEIAILRQCWAEGLSAREIANAVGRTRSAVCGMAYRLKLSHPETQRRASMPRVPRHVRTRPPVRRMPKFNKVRHMEKLAPVDPLNIPFLETAPGQCRAVTDPTRFEQRCCGHPTTERGVYCPAHEALHHEGSRSKAMAR